MTHDSPRSTWMTTPYRRRLGVLSDAAHLPLLGDGLCGVERETLRVDAAGRLALTQHPHALGAALTHPSITTDYAEPLLEFVTPPQHDAADVIERLDELHRFACRAIGDELLWSQSMPCPLDDDRRIPIAWYGTSNIGILKHVYRRGLAFRYGKAMQCIAGIHYNYSLADAVWPLLRDVRDGCEPAGRDARDMRSAGYLALIRNFHRYGWLLLYLFGASPALCAGFVAGDRHGLDAFDAQTLYLPHATSLRMSDLGYQNRVQGAFAPCLDNLPAYLDGLARAVAQPCPEYQAIGAKRDGEWLQLSTHLLQMENEFYSSIRPKRTVRSGERPLDALRSRGVEYVEVRCLDIDPFAPHGVAETTLRFVDAFLLFCALDDSPCLAGAEQDACRRNFAAVAREGRRRGSSCSVAASASRCACGRTNCSRASTRRPACWTCSAATRARPPRSTRNTRSSTIRGRRRRRVCSMHCTRCATIRAARASRSGCGRRSRIPGRSARVRCRPTCRRVSTRSRPNR